METEQETYNQQEQISIENENEMNHLEMNENETKEENQIKLQEYLHVKQTHLSGVFASFINSIDSSCIFSSDELNSFLNQMNLNNSNELNEIDENKEKEMNSLSFMNLMEKDMQWTIENYNNEMNIYSSLFGVYNKYISWIYNQTE